MGTLSEAAGAVVEAGLAALTGGPIAAAASVGRSASKIGAPRIGEWVRDQRASQALKLSLVRWASNLGYGEADVELGMAGAQRILNSFGLSLDEMATLNLEPKRIATEVLRRGSTIRERIGDEGARETCDQSVQYFYLHLVESLENSQPMLAATREILKRLPAGAQVRSSKSVEAGIDGATVLVQPLVRGYRREVESLAPLQLKDRDSELRELRTFVTGDHGSWWWWRARPWAGKSAVMASFALSPPEGVCAVYFFVLGRQQGANSRRDFYSAVLPQLASASLAERVALPTDPRQARDQLVYWLEEAAAASKAAGNRLVLLVDGLDEDSALIDSPARLASIAGALPDQLPKNVRVVVASRENPELSVDVGDTHPLLNGSCWHKLAPSKAADTARRAATADLKDLIRTMLGRDVAGLIAAAAAPLTVADLTELAEADPLDVEALIAATRPGRSFIPVASVLETDRRLGYRLGHDKLDELLVGLLNPRAPAREGLDPQYWADIRSATLEPWRQRVHDWGRKWATLGWPIDTPGYLLDPAYPQLIVQDPGGEEELVNVLRDEKRNRRLFQVHQTDYLAVAQIRTAASHLVSLPLLDLTRLGKLLATQEELVNRFSWIAKGALRLLVKLDQGARALHVARSLPNPEDQIAALTEVARASAESGDMVQGMGAAELALAATLEIMNMGSRVTALEDVMRAFIAVGALDRAREAADLAMALCDIRSEHTPFNVLVNIAEAFVADDVGWTRQILEEAGRQAEQVHDVGVRARLHTDLAPLLASAGDIPRAVQVAQVGATLAGVVKDPTSRAILLARLARMMGATGDIPLARSWLEQAVEASKLVSGGGVRGEVMTHVLQCLVVVGDSEGAIMRATGVIESGSRVAALTEVALALRAAGESGRAREVAEHALEVIGETRQDENLGGDEAARAAVLAEVARALAASGDLDRAKDLAWRAAEAGDRALSAGSRTISLAGASEALTEAGELDRGREVAAKSLKECMGLSPLDAAIPAVGAVLKALVAAGDVRSAHELLARLTGAGSRALALADLSMALADSSDLELARTVAKDALGLARGCPNEGRALASASVARAFAACGDRLAAGEAAKEAVVSACEVASRPDLTEVLLSVVDLLAAAGELDAAGGARLTDALSNGIEPSGARARVLVDLGWAWAASGDLDRAGSLAHSSLESIGAAFRESRPPLISTRRRRLTAIRRFDVVSLNPESGLRGPKAGLPPQATTEAPVEIAWGLLSAGDLSGARDLALQLDDPRVGGRLLSETARAQLALGKPEEALWVAGEALALAGYPARPRSGPKLLEPVIRSLVRNGQTDRALTIGETFLDKEALAESWAQVSRLLLDIGDFDRGTEVAGRAAQLVVQLGTPAVDSTILTHLGLTLVAVGSLDSAEDVAARIVGSQDKAHVLVELGRALAASGQLERADGVVTRAIEVAGHVATSVSRARVSDLLK